MNIFDAESEKAVPAFSCLWDQADGTWIRTLMPLSNPWEESGTSRSWLSATLE